MSIESGAGRTNISQRYFNPLLISMYDFLVYRVVSQYIWGCSNALLIQRYQHYVSPHHLEVGVGTGYLVDKSDANISRLDLMDLSRACLRKSSKRLHRYYPSVIRHNVLEKPFEEDKRYDSIGINYVMHCVAGDFTDKGIVFGNLKKLLTNRGVIFGATVLKTDQSSTRANIFMRFLNRIGIFNNTNDNYDDLKHALEKHFRHVSVFISDHSSVALFAVSDEQYPINELEIVPNKINNEV